MSKSSKVLSFAMAAILAASVAGLSGCSSGSSGSSSSASVASPSSAPADTASSTASGTASGADSGTVSINPNISGTITEGSWNVAYTAMQAEAQAFMQLYPNCTVNVIEADSDYTKLYAELAAGSGVPDVVQTQNVDFPAFLNKYPNAWADISDIMAPQANNFVPYVLPMVSKDGKYYAVPWDLGPCALFYRKDLFQQAGIDPTTLTTWDKYIAAGQQLLSSSDGKVYMLGFQYNQGGGPSNMILNELGGTLYDSSGKVQLNTPQALQAIGIIQKMISTGIAENLPSDWNDRITGIENNTIATVPTAVWYSGTLEQSVTDQSGEWGIVPLPAVTEGGNNEANAGGSVLAISSASQDMDLAKAFVQFSLMTNQGNAINLQVGGLFSSYQPSYSDPSYSAVDSYFGVSLGQYFAALSPNIPQMDYGPYYTDVYNAQNTAWGEIFINNEDPATALTDATTAAQKAIDAES